MGIVALPVPPNGCRVPAWIRELTWRSRNQAMYNLLQGNEALQARQETQQVRLTDLPHTSERDGICTPDEISDPLYASRGEVVECLRATGSNDGRCYRRDEVSLCQSEKMPTDR